MDQETAAPVCRSCGGALPPKAKFCPSCGMRIVEHLALQSEFDGEHRQITVLFCDLVGSTELAARLHSEDLRVLLREYQLICAEAIERHDGMISHYLGDGVIANFGYPRAREDAAIRAVDAALEIVRRLEALDRDYLAGAGAGLAARIALHTGRVLVGEMGMGETREHHALTGIVPNIAARLQEHAPRNGVVVSPQTRALVGGSFVLRSLGEKTLKGVPGTVEVLHVTGRANPTSVLGPRDIDPVGRDAELAALAGAWGQAAAGRACVVISAEPGAGKSTLAAAFLARAGIPRDRIIELSGGETRRHAPYSSLSMAIGRWLAQVPGQPAEAESARLAGWFDADPDGAARHAETFARLLHPNAETEPPAPRTVFEAALAFARSRTQPLLFVVEDAHWVDASTLDLLDQVTAHPEVRAMILVLTREGADFAWSGPVDTQLRLEGLSREDSLRLIEATAGGPIEAALAQRILEATNGLPLYLEEFTRSLLESGGVTRVRGVFRAASLDAPVRTPVSLLDLITARLDTLGEAKLLAQVCAVLGPTLARTALIEVTALPTEQVDMAIATLSMAGVLSVARGGVLSFRHALFQTAAYESLVRAARRTWHARYLAYLEADSERPRKVRPEILAHHLEGAERLREALDAYLEAGLAANRASAPREAAAHFEKCLDLATRAPTGSVDAALGLRLQVLFAGALLSARGPGSPEARAAYDAALALAERTPECEWQLPAYWGWWRVSENFAAMAQRAKTLLEVSERMQGREFRLQAQHCVWANSFQQGDLEASLSSAFEGLEIYEAGGFDDKSVLYGGHDCKVCALGEIALASWLRGAGDAAVAQVEASLAHAERLGHVGSLAHALDIAVMLHHYRGDAQAVAGVARRLDLLSEANDLEEYRAKARLFLGASRLAADDESDVAGALSEIEAGFAVLRDIGTPEDFPVYQCMRAEALRRLGRGGEAAAALDEGRAIILSQGVNYWSAELARNEALVGATRPDPDAAAIRDCLKDAEAIARGQGALMLQLRAATSRWRLAPLIGDAEAARARIAVLLALLPEGARGRDIESARAATVA